MAEQQVTIGGNHATRSSHRFFVVAHAEIQSSSEGVYQLPDAQRDPLHDENRSLTTRPADEEMTILDRMAVRFSRSDTQSSHQSRRNSSRCKRAPMKCSSIGP